MRAAWRQPHRLPPWVVWPLLWLARFRSWTWPGPAAGGLLPPRDRDPWPKARRQPRARLTFRHPWILPLVLPLPVPPGVPAGPVPLPCSPAGPWPARDPCWDRRLQNRQSHRLRLHLPANQNYPRPQQPPQTRQRPSLQIPRAQSERRPKRHSARHLRESSPSDSFARRPLPVGGHSLHPQVLSACLRCPPVLPWPPRRSKHCSF
mmetsp:Transcript_6562/g.13560  ORF Transcript_6562/g.13560 Transcript_6562/m.13560 type:complete len:205 (+) Transcript_6562:388-1002(+)